MAIYTGKVKRGNPSKPQEQKKWYLYSKSIGTVSEKEVARQLANRTALNQKEAEMALFLLREIVLENLLRGYTVKLSDWAYFYTTLKCEGAENEKDATALKVKRVKLHLGHDKSFENDLQMATFTPLSSLMKKGETEQG